MLTCFILSSPLSFFFLRFALLDFSITIPLWITGVRVLPRLHKDKHKHSFYSTMAKPKLNNVLPNTYVPVLSKKVLTVVLSRLPKSSIISLILLWPQLKNTQPLLRGANTSQKEYNRQVRNDAKQMRAQSSKWKKSKLVDRILFEYWTDGLNLLQLAQIDCQLIVDNPNAYFWVLSTVKNAWGEQVPLSLDPPLFLKRLARELSKIFMSYIYVCTHPNLPLVLIRIQVFDLLPSNRQLTKRLATQRSHITSHKPYFLAVPMNSPHLIHSPGNDLVSEIVLQVVESSLAESPRELLLLDMPKLQKAVRSLESMHILKGVSRFANSLGPWIPYADGEADISPLANLEDHPVLVNKVEACASAQEKLEKMANIRFKGTPSGNIKSDKLFEDNKSLQKRRRLDVDNEDESLVTRLVKKSRFSTVAPIRYAEFTIKSLFSESNEADDDLSSNVAMKLVGTDVFAGLHELATKTTNPEEAVVIPEELPGWLTGEEGLSCGTVRNGIFTQD